MIGHVCPATARAQRRHVANGPASGLKLSRAISRRREPFNAAYNTRSHARLETPSTSSPTDHKNPSTRYRQPHTQWASSPAQTRRLRVRPFPDIRPFEVLKYGAGAIELRGIPWLHIARKQVLESLACAGSSMAAATTALSQDAQFELSGADQASEREMGKEMEIEEERLLTLSEVYKQPPPARRCARPACPLPTATRAPTCSSP